MKEELKSALSIFCAFSSFIDAMEREGEFDNPIDDNTCVTRLDFGGGHIQLNVGHFRRLAKVFSNECNFEQLVNGKWVFIDETENYSPEYTTREEAEEAFKTYCKDVLGV